VVLRSAAWRASCAHRATARQAAPLGVLHQGARRAAQAPRTLPLPNLSLCRAGTNKNYPNPPGWGLSLHVNGFETPVLRVVRGVPYNFTIEAGETHPVYITDTIIGGGARAPWKERVGDPDLRPS